MVVDEQTSTNYHPVQRMQAFFFLIHLSMQVEEDIRNKLIRGGIRELTLKYCLALNVLYLCIHLILPAPSMLGRKANIYP